MHKPERVSVVECLPGRRDDVLVHTYGVPLAHAVGRSDEDPRDGAGAVRSFEDADLVVDELERRQLRMQALERLPERAVECVDGPVALTGRDEALPLRVQ